MKYDFDFWGIDEMFLEPCCALKYYPEMEVCSKVSPQSQSSACYRFLISCPTNHFSSQNFTRTVFTSFSYLLSCYMYIIPDGPFDKLRAPQSVDRLIVTTRKVIDPRILRL